MSVAGAGTQEQGPRRRRPPGLSGSARNQWHCLSPGAQADLTFE